MQTSQHAVQKKTYEDTVKETKLAVARELHDTVAQALTGVAYNIDKLQRSSSDKETQRELKKIQRNLAAAQQDLRYIMGDLRSQTKRQQHLVQVLRKATAKLAKEHSVNVYADIETEHYLEPAIEHEFAQLAKEALANIAKHATAQNVTVLWRCDGSFSALEITDDGVGFEDGFKADAYGVLGMKERATNIGATFNLISNPEKGTIVQCILEKM